VKPELGLHKSTFYINTEIRPWINKYSYPRRAGINVFGYTGIYTHTLLEEYTNGNEVLPESPLLRWDTEVITIQAEKRSELIKTTRLVLNFCTDNPDILLKDLAFTLNCQKKINKHCLAIIATTLPDLKKKLEFALKKLRDTKCQRLNDKSGIYYFSQQLSQKGKLAFLFSGEGSQYINMLSDLCIHFSEVREIFDNADRAFARGGTSLVLSDVLFPPSHVTQETSKLNETTIWDMEYAVMGINSADIALYTILKKLDIQPDIITGHSAGQDVALWVAGAFSDFDQEKFFDFSLLTRNKQLLEEDIPAAKLLTVGASTPETVADIVKDCKGELYISMDNCPNQVILCGSEQSINNALKQLGSQGAICSLLPFERGYHTPWFNHVCDLVRKYYQEILITPPKIQVYSCATAQPYPKAPNEICKIMVDQWAKPVRFRETIETMYNDGVRIFLEIGPGGTLTSFVEDTLCTREFTAVSSNLSSRSGICQLHHMVGLLAAHGVSMDLSFLYQKRSPKQLPVMESVKNHLLKKTICPDNPLKKQKKLLLNKNFQKLSFCRKTLATITDNLIDRAHYPPTLKFSAQELNSSSKTTPLSSVSPNFSTNRIMDNYFQSMESFLIHQNELLDSTLHLVKPHLKTALRRIIWQDPAKIIPTTFQPQVCLCTENNNAISSSDFAQHILAPEELTSWQGLTGTEVRKRQWLRGRMAAKDAVFLLMKKNGKQGIEPKDILIVADQHGRPSLSGECQKRLACHSCVSIAHADDTSVAVAIEKSQEITGIGIDIEQAGRKTDGLAAGGFNEEENALINKLKKTEYLNWLLRAWCAKEALSKAIGRGLLADPLNIIIHQIIPQSGEMKLEITGVLAQIFPKYAGRLITVCTGCNRNLIFAISIL